MKKFLEYLEQHPVIRLLIILSSIVGLVASAPTIYHWCVKNKTSKDELPSSNSQSLPEYFTPTHRIKYIINNNLVQIRNRPLTELESKEVKFNVAESQTIDANTIIGQINCQTRLRILKHDSSFFKIQYFDGVKAIIGYMPDSIALISIQPSGNNKYGLGNGEITVYTNNTYGVAELFLDDKLIGTLNSYFKDGARPSCDSRNGVISIITKAGEHVIIGKDNSGSTWKTHVSLYEGQCYLLNFSYPQPNLSPTE